MSATLFQYASDIHLDDDPHFDVLEILIPTAPNLILAGDIGQITNPCLLPFLVSCCNSFSKVIVVMGNHEYYGFTFEHVQERWKYWEKKLPQLSVLIDETIQVDNVLVFGATYWSNVSSEARYHLPLFRRSQTPGKRMVRLTRDDYLWMHYTSRACLKNAYHEARLRGLKLLVVTHYPPSFRVLRSKYYVVEDNGKILVDPTSTLYASDCEDDAQLADVWIFGHTSYNGDETKTLGDELDGETLARSWTIGMTILLTNQGMCEDSFLDARRVVIL